MADSISAVKQWIVDQHPQVDDIPDDLDLFEADLLSSLQFIEFMVVIEDAGGIEVDREELQPDDFRTLADIRRRFFPQTVSAQQ